MRRYGTVLAFVFLNASASAQPAEEAALGRRLYEQHCGVCHAPILHVNNPLYGPVLHRDIVAGRETALGELIAKGTPRMPGFQHMLSPAEIGAIVVHLKTLSKPAGPAGPSASGERAD
jgi:mono/diheme cytochrome c family protein